MAVTKNSSTLGDIDTLKLRMSEQENLMSEKVAELKELASNGGSAEIIDARKSANGTVFVTLKARMDDSDAQAVAHLADNATQLALKATITDVNTQIAAVASAAPKAVSLVSQMTDITKNYVYTGAEAGYTTGNWYYWNGSNWTSGGIYQSAGISDSSIKLRNVTYKPVNNGTPSKNLFDQDAITSGTYLLNTGVEVTNAPYFVTSYIPVNANTQYYLNSTNVNRRICYYSSVKAFIGYADGANAITTPANTAYLKITNANAELSTMQLEQGTSFTGYKPFGYYVEEDNLGDVLKGVLNGYKDNISSYVTGTPSKNLFNKTTASTGNYIAFANGNKTVNASYAASDYIRILSNTDYAVNYFEQVAFYDKDKVYISGVGGVGLLNQTFKSPMNATYIRVSVTLANLNVYQLEQGTTSTSYSKYGILVNRNILDDDLTQSLVEFKRITNITKMLTNSTTKIKLIGDSITAGVGGTGYAQDGATIYGSFRENLNGTCWANSLRDYLQSKFTNCTVKNWGTSGVTSSMILSNISTLVESDDNIVICMIGTNDRISANNITTSLLVSNLNSISSYITSIGKEIIFMSSIPASVTNETDGTRAYHMEDVDIAVFGATSSLNREYISLYKELMNYCDLKGITIDSLLSDGLHPNDTGYLTMFNIICDKLGIGRKRPGATW